MPLYKCEIHLPDIKLHKIDIWASSREEVARLISVHLPHNKGFEIEEVDG